MRILLLHNRYQFAGGEDAVVRSEASMLRGYGHDVEVVEVNNDSIQGPRSKASAALHAFYSQASYRAVRRALSCFRPDVVHIHNWFPVLSPSVFFACAHSGIAAVQTLHNYRLTCSNALLFRDGAPCEDCVGSWLPVSGVLHGCYRGSRLGSAVVGAVMRTHELIGTWKKVRMFIAVSEFQRSLLVRAGVPKEKTVVKPNFVDEDPGVGHGEGGYALLVSRLTPEKGLRTVLRAWEKLGDKTPLIIVGDGPLAQEVRERAGSMRGVSYVGPKPPSEVFAYMQRAMVLLFPSEWYETFGRVAAEAYAAGTPVIGSRIGAVAEIVDDKKTGLYFTPGSADDLAAKVMQIACNPDVQMRMRGEARACFEKNFTKEANYRALMEIYRQARGLPAAVQYSAAAHQQQEVAGHSLY